MLRYNRSSPSVRSGASGCGVVAVMPGHPHRSGRPPATGSAPWAAPNTSACPAGRGIGARPLVAKIERTSAARHRLNATARCRAARSGSSPWVAPRVRISTISMDSLVTPAAAAPVRNTSATGPGPRNAFSLAVLCRPARLVGAWPAVVLIDDAGLARCDQGVLGKHLPGDRRDDAQSVLTTRGPPRSTNSSGSTADRTGLPLTTRRPPGVFLFGSAVEARAWMRPQRTLLWMGGVGASLAVGVLVESVRPGAGWSERAALVITLAR